MKTRIELVNLLPEHSKVAELGCAEGLFIDSAQEKYKDALKLAVEAATPKKQ